MDVKKYLQRIGFSGEVTVDLVTLEKLQKRHLSAVPFENLDIFVGKDITLDLPSTYRKIVDCKRGGWCYHLNGLFCWLLREVGFTVDMVCGRVWKQGAWSRRFAHIVLVAHVEGKRYMVDVAWGGISRSPLKPLLIKEDEVTDMANTTIRMMRDGDLWFAEFLEGASWERYFSFYLEPRELEDFQEMSDLLQLPGSPLANMLLVGKKDVADDTLWHCIRFRRYDKVRSVGRGEKSFIASEADLSAERLEVILKDNFGIVMDLKDIDCERWKEGLTELSPTFMEPD